MIDNILFITLIVLMLAYGLAGIICGG